MSISIAAIKTAYDALGVLVTASEAAYDALIANGPKPAYPTEAAADADYNSVTAAIATWQTNQDTLTAAFNAAVTAQQAQELVVTNLMPSNQWITLSSLANWGGAVTQNIGIPKPNSVPSPVFDTSLTLYSILAISTNANGPFPEI